MRTLVLLIAASAASILLHAPRATAEVSTTGASAVRTPANSAPSPITLVEISSQPRPDGGVRVHYTILQRVQPLVTARSAGNGAPAAAIVSNDVVVSYDQAPDGWLALGTLTVDRYGPHSPAAASLAPAAVRTTDESATSAPLSLAIAPVRPDPVRSRAFVVDVALPGAEPARLELMDVMGRRVAMHDLGGLGAGRHTVDLGAGQRFAPGVYLLRLTQGRDARVARVTIVD
jgi:hypothetical protein